MPSFQTLAALRSKFYRRRGSGEIKSDANDDTNSSSALGNCEAIAPFPIPLAEKSSQGLSGTVSSSTPLDRPPQPFANAHDLWNEALMALGESERENVKVFTGEVNPDRCQTYELVDDIRKDIDAALLRNENEGTARVFVERTVSVLNKFVSVGEVVVSFDPVHAALPWAGVRFVLKVIEKSLYFHYSLCVQSWTLPC
jgi:hypothetical protein